MLFLLMPIYVVCSVFVVACLIVILEWRGFEERLVAELLVEVVLLAALMLLLTDSLLILWFTVIF